MAVRANLLLFAVLGLPLMPVGVSAQTVPPPVPQAVPEVDAPPTVDPAVAIQGRALAIALRNGGFVLYMRHAQQTVPTPTCENANLTAVGEEQARTVGAGMRALGIPIGTFMVSPTCRTQDTARLLGVGTAEVNEHLAPTAPPGIDLMMLRKQMLATPPAAGTNTLLVSHVFGGELREDWLHLELAEVIVFHPDGHGRTQAVARIPVAEWANLVNATAP